MILLLLVGGAIVNIAVAWGIGAQLRLPRGQTRNVLAADEALELWRIYSTDATRSPDPRYPPRGWREHRTMSTATWFGTNLFQSPEGFPSGFSLPDEIRYDIVLIESGWPMRSLRRMQTHVVSPSRVFGHVVPIIDHKQWWREARPLWPGFAINTLLYAAVLWLMFVAPFALRRRRRIKRGLCPKCAYPVGTSDVCTECGASVVPAQPSNSAQG